VHFLLFQDEPGDHPPGGGDVRPVSIVIAERRGPAARRGIDITHETVQLWWNQFGTIFAAEIRRSRVQVMRHFQHWHLDELIVKINRVKHYLWRAVDHEQEVLESFVTKRRDKKAALNCRYTKRNSCENR
jgi:transposase-like protein